VLFLYVFQASLVYFPTRSLTATPRVVPLGNSRFTGSFGTRYLTGGLYSLVT